jgi:flagellar biosynthetic protein FlhB
VARSQDIPSAVMVFTGFLALELLGPQLWFRLMAFTRTALGGEGPSSEAELEQFAMIGGLEMLKVLVPIMLLVVIAGVGALFAQVGWLITWQPLKPNLDRLNPISGAKRLFSVRSVMLAVTNFAKLLVVAAVAYMTMTAAAPEIVHAFVLGGAEVFALGAALVSRLAFRLSAVLLILALLDYAYQRYRHERDLRMTKEEVKDEMRSMEGDPVIKRRRREVQMRLAMQRLKKDMAQADVVVTNPTHLAIAMQYDPALMSAPKVVAKGADYMALRIRRLAVEYGVPVVERKALARMMYDAVEVGQTIPERFYQAIAEILAYVYELTGRRVA